MLIELNIETVKLIPTFILLEQSFLVKVAQTNWQLSNVILGQHFRGEARDRIYNLSEPV